MKRAKEEQKASERMRDNETEVEESETDAQERFRKCWTKRLAKVRDRIPLYRTLGQLPLLLNQILRKKSQSNG